MKDLVDSDRRDGFLTLNGTPGRQFLVHPSRGFYRDDRTGQTISRRQAETLALSRRWLAQDALSANRGHRGGPQTAPGYIHCSRVFQRLPGRIGSGLIYLLIRPVPKGYRQRLCTSLHVRTLCGDSQL